MVLIRLSNNGRKIAAYSLLEILIVVALLAGIMSIATPKLFRGLQADLPRTTRQVASYVNNLRYLSIINQQPLQLVFNFETNQCIVYSRKDGAWQIDDSFKKLELPKEVTFKYFLADTRLITAKQASVNILPFGYVSQFQITLQKGQDKLYFKVTSIIGESEIGDDTSLFY